MDRAWISLGHCTYDKWCPCWKCVMFRTNFESFSHRWCTLNMSTSFHEAFILSKVVKVVKIIYTYTV
jgi:hypothetical protein